MARNYRTPAFICFAIYLIWATFPSNYHHASYELYHRSRYRHQFYEFHTIEPSTSSSIIDEEQKSIIVTETQNSRNLQEAKVLLPICPDPPANLLGELKVSFNEPIVDKISNNSDYPLINGGMFRPRNCTSRHGRVAIIVPYRNRKKHLTALLNHLHPILQRQQLNYVIIVVEQAGNDTFNKALLMNIAYKESQQLVDPNDYETQFQCYIFHDVDLFTEDDRGIYACRDLPIHLSEYVDKLRYKPFPGRDVLFGGAVAIPRRHFELVNGFSNVFFGWGGEDDEMRARFKSRRIAIFKAGKNDHFRYKMFRHTRDKENVKNQNRFHLIETTGQRMLYDGLNSLKYRFVSRTDYPAYTHFLVEFSKQEVMNTVFQTVK